MSSLQSTATVAPPAAAKAGRPPLQKGQQTRAAILDAALGLASSAGLEGLSIGVLAEVMQMSKSGVFAHFGSREELQISVIREYHARFEEEVFFPAIRQPRGLGALRFAERYSGSFHNEGFGGKTRQLTAPACHEGEVRQGPDALPLRSVVCLRAYRKLPGLYDMSVLAATLDARTVGAQGRFDAHGVSWENALRLADHYLKGFAWLPNKPASH